MIERRHIQTSECLFRALEGGGHEITGYAALYNVLSHPLWRDWESGKEVRERILPGAFDEADISDVTFNLNHDDHYLLGRTLSKTLILTPDDRGLPFRDIVPNTQLGRDVGEMMARGDLSQNSFAFTVREEDTFREDGGEFLIENIRRIRKVYDVSLVTRAAYPQPFSVYRSDALEVRSLHSGNMTREELEALARRISPASAPEPGTGDGEFQRKLALARLALDKQRMEIFV